MTKERLEELLQNVMDWAFNHNTEFQSTLITRIGITEEELTELGFEPVKE